MRLSEAIALGRFLVEARPGAEWATGGGGCARGAALEAIGRRVSTHKQTEIFLDAWPWTKKVINYPCSCTCNGADQTVANIITHLFDLHVMTADKDWTYEHLIEWVRSVEPQEATPVSGRKEADTAEIMCVTQ